VGCKKIRTEELVSANERKGRLVVNLTYIGYSGRNEETDIHKLHEYANFIEVALL
jgi:hypothetical protein